MGSETLTRYIFDPFKNYIKKLNMSKIKGKTPINLYTETMSKINNLKISYKKRIKHTMMI